MLRSTLREAQSDSKRMLAGVLFALVMLASVVQPAHGIGSIAPDARIVVGVKNASSVEQADEIAASVGGVVTERMRRLRAFVILSPLSALESTLATLRADARVRYAQLDVSARVAATGTDPYYTQQWALKKIDAEAAWTKTRGASAPLIAVVDTGVDASHPDLAGRVAKQRDIANDDAVANDYLKHGTGVAGVIAAVAGNGIGVAGACPECRLIAVKVFKDGSTSAMSSDIAKGIRYAVDAGAKVVNLSLGSSSGSRVMKDAIDYATGKGVVIVASAGNTGSAGLNYPAAYPNVIAVSSTTSTDTLAGSSSYGAGLHVSAPGERVHALKAGGGIVIASGTSFAAPLVSAAAALAFTQSSSATTVTQLIIRGAADLGQAGYDTRYGHGRLNLAGVVGASTQTSAPLTLSTSSLPAGTVGGAYSAVLSVSGGTKPYTFTLASGSLPSGLALSSGGVLSGTPSVSGVSTATIRVQDGEGQKLERSFSVSVTGASQPVEAVAPLALSTSSLPAGTVGSAYSAVISVSGGTKPYAFTLSSGSLPSGLTLSSGGVLYGTPSVSGVSTAAIRVQDGQGQKLERSFSVSVTGAQATTGIFLSTSSLPTGTVGSAYNTALSVSGGTKPYTFTLASGSLPPGLTLSSGGVLSGTPSVSGSWSVRLRVTDANDDYAERLLTLSIGTAQPVAGSVDISASWRELARSSTGFTAKLDLRASGGGAPVFDVTVKLIDGNNKTLASRSYTTPYNLSNGATLTLSLNWTCEVMAGLKLRADIDTTGVVSETNEQNNVALAWLP